MVFSGVPLVLTPLGFMSWGVVSCSSSLLCGWSQVTLCLLFIPHPLSPTGSRSPHLPPGRGSWLLFGSRPPLLPSTVYSPRDAPRELPERSLKPSSDFQSHVGADPHSSGEALCLTQLPLLFKMTFPRMALPSRLSFWNTLSFPGCLHGRLF